jgi:cyclopropane fatty-acyl-phospholipid synthase-like methyltransferase
VSSDNVNLTELLANDRFPMSSRYDQVWVAQNNMGPSALWLTEWLCEEMTLEPGMRVLDMGCGKALSSIFLAKEFGVRVWANDLWIKPTENWERIKAAGVEDQVFPVHAEARSLPYAEGFFDAIVCIDSYTYYGTDDLYLAYFSKFVRPGGQIGIMVPGLTRDFEDGVVPEHLTRRQRNGGTFWDPRECFSFHTARWWRRHWQQTGLADVEVADTLEDGWRYWLQWDKAVAAAGLKHFPSDEEALETDQGRYIGFVRMVARRKEG